MKTEKTKIALNSLSEGVDYYFNGEGKMVLTEKYLLKKGSCCGNGCLHCPYQQNKNRIAGGAADKAANAAK